MEFDITPKRYEELARLIAQAESPVGIDAEKTHILILDKLEQMNTHLQRLEERLERLESRS